MEKVDLSQAQETIKTIEDIYAEIKKLQNPREGKEVTPEQIADAKRSIAPAVRKFKASLPELDKQISNLSDRVAAAQLNVLVEKMKYIVKFAED